MATGGIFQLITNDGKQDKMLMASDLLKDRLISLTKLAPDGKTVISSPTLYDIERTHVLFTNAHFKPFAAIGFEYNRVTSSQTSLGASTTNVKFSIPQFGDFFCDMVVNVKISAPTMTYAAETAVSDRNLLRWAAYPGERIFKNVSFTVNGNPLDSYGSVETNFHREFHVQPNSLTGWNRCVGNEEIETGYLEQPTWVGNNVSVADIKHRVVVNSTSGNQTPAGEKSALDLWIPLLFWFNKDPRLAIPSVAIPYGQRYIDLELCKRNDIVGEYPRGAGTWDNNALTTNGTITKDPTVNVDLYINNIFVNPEIHNIFIQRVGFNLIRVHKSQTQSTTKDDKLLLNSLKWPIETLYIGIKNNAYHLDDTKSRQHLDKWHKFSTVTPTKRTTQGWLSEKSFAVRSTKTTLGTALQELLKTTGDTFTFITIGGTDDAALSMVANSVVDKSLFSLGSVMSYTDAADVLFSFKVVSEGSGTVFTLINLNSATAGAIYLGTLVIKSLVITNSVTEQSFITDVLTPNITELGIQAHGITLYSSMNSIFYNAYLPLTYGGAQLNTPKDSGALLMTFCLYPGIYQPSGHINVSRARELYLDYKVQASTINASNPGTIYICASAINFLLISDGSAVLRYST